MEEFFSRAVTWLKDPLVMLVFGVVFATVVINFFANRLVKRMETRAQRTESVWDDALVNTIKG
ncbi:MAG: hypothetical protein HUJ31_14525, partial [Pseudomonadales bacterium]|nr:hypothetical protein [Pseudomonadales bacterium]